jgi:hypothetical protein
LYTSGWAKPGTFRLSAVIWMALSSIMSWPKL